MESFGNERKVQQGEDWNLDILLSSSAVEYIPYIISSERVNPFIVITVASTKYEKNLRYVKSWWNDIKDPLIGKPIPTFYQTVPYYYGELDTLDELPNEPPILEEDNEAETPSTRLLYQYTLETDEINEESGHRPYHYFYFDYDGEIPVRVDEYECAIKFNFSTTDTSNWGSQNYIYQITLVSGQLLADVLNEIKVAHGNPKDWPNTVEAQYKYVKTRWPNELQPDIDVDSPLGRIDKVEPLLLPTKLEVSNNLRNII